jgi:CheY-like chemotaxis protein
MSSHASPEKTVEILLVEDNPADVELTKQGFLEGKIPSRLSVARDGLEAMAFLRREGQFANAPRPDFILLDLNMPKMDGREVLAEVKNDERLKSIPIVVLTTSDADNDVIETYRRHGNAYMQKPVDFDQFVEVVKGIGDYWFTLVKLPPND